MRAVAIGASAGGIDALGVILPRLPAETPFPVLVVVHVPAGRPSLLAEIFRAKCALPVREPFDKDPVERGVWFAPAGYHLLVNGEAFALSIDEPVNFSRPSIDVLFETAAETYGAGLTAVVLTGASDDGARGAERVRGRGGRVIVQDPDSADAPEMPRAALRGGAADFVGTPARIADMLRDLANESSSPVRTP